MEANNNQPNVSQDEVNTFLKVFNEYLRADLNARNSLVTGADYKVFVTRTE
jgi:hypothetical protein